MAPDHIGMGLSEKPAGYRLHARLAHRRPRGAGRPSSACGRSTWWSTTGAGRSALGGRAPARAVGRIVILNTAAFPSDRGSPRRIALCRVPVLGAFLVRGLNAFAEPATWMAMSARAASPGTSGGATSSPTTAGPTGSGSTASSGTSRWRRTIRAAARWRRWPARCPRWPAIAS
jgi:hypothetical protein